MPSSELPDVLEEALARVVARQHKEWIKERERIGAEARATIAEQRAEIAELRAQTTSMMAELTATTRAALLEVEKALSCVKDGKDGEAGPRGPQGDPGIPGKDADSEQIVAIVKEQVLAALPPPEKGDPGKDADLDQVSAKAAVLVLENLPLPQDGKDADPEAVAKIVLERLPKPKDGEKGDKGDRGEDVDMDLVAVMIEEATREAVSQWPVPKDGKDADPELIRSMVREEVAKWPEPQPGRDGKDADPDVIRQMVKEEVAQLPPPEKGEKGDRGDPGPEVDYDLIVRLIDDRVKEIPQPKDGVGMAGLVIDRNGCCIATMTDGAMRDLGPVVGKDGDPGKDGRDGKDGDPGKDGRDGLSIEDLSGEFDGERTLILRFSRGEITKEIPIYLPIPLDRGLFKESKAYRQGDGVTYNGAFWIAQKDAPTGKPGDGSTDWRLSVKGGPAGASAYSVARDAGFRGSREEWLESLKGPKGDPGRPGVDFTARG